jgi:hypothetical protein
MAVSKEPPFFEVLIRVVKFSASECTLATLKEHFNLKQTYCTNSPPIVIVAYAWRVRVVTLTFLIQLLKTARPAKSD